MLLHIFLLSLYSVQYLADATSVSATYLKVQQPVNMGPVIVTTLKSTSRVECAMDCLSRNCLCFSFDYSLLECGIGNCLLPNTNIGATQEFFSSCNSDKGFQPITSGSVTTCLWVSNTQANYSIARNDCKARSAYLYTVKTINKLNIIRSNSFPNNYWIGLNYIVAEDAFRWEDDNTICNSTCQTQIFLSGEPNNKYLGNNECVMYDILYKLLVDGGCNGMLYYICEQKLL